MTIEPVGPKALERFRRAMLETPWDEEAWEEESRERRRRRVEVLAAARREVLAALDAECRDDVASFRKHLLRAVAATAPTPRSEVERYDVTAESTGYRGGNAGHGGYAYVRFRNDEGHSGRFDHSGRLDADDEGKPYNRNHSGWADVGSTFTVTIEAHGDWEQSRLYVAVLEAAIALSETLEEGHVGVAQTQAQNRLETDSKQEGNRK
jgi:hypothetical protein